MFETKGLESGPSIALPKCLPPVAMMAQKFHQEMFLGVSGFQCDTIDIYRLENHDLSMDKIAKSEMMFGYFMIFEKNVYGICGICSGKKKKT